MEKNIAVLNKWKNEIDCYEKLTFEQAQSIYKRISECDDKKVRKYLRDKLITGTLYVVYDFISVNGYIYMNGISYDMNDIISSSVEAWIKRLDSGVLLNVDNFKKVIARDFYNEVNNNMGISVDIDSKEYLYSVRDFTELVAYYLKKKEDNPDFDFFDLVDDMKENRLLERVYMAYYLKQYRFDSEKKNCGNLLKKSDNEYDMSAFELLDGIVKSFESEKVHLPKTTLYNIRYLVINNGLEYQREDINNLVVDDLEEQFDKKELGETIFELLDELVEVKPLHKSVLIERFGLFDEAKTLDKVGIELGISRDCVRDNEVKALRRLRHPSRARKLKPYLYR